MTTSVAINKRSADNANELKVRPGLAFQRAPKKASPIDNAVGRLIIQALAVLIFLGAWELGVQAGMVSSFMVGSPIAIGNALLRAAQSGMLFVDTGYTQLLTHNYFLLPCRAQRAGPLRRSAGLACRSRWPWRQADRRLYVP
jgi:hypothetical protein